MILNDKILEIIPLLDFEKDHELINALLSKIHNVENNEIVPYKGYIRQKHRNARIIIDFMFYSELDKWYYDNADFNILAEEVDFCCNSECNFNDSNDDKSSILFYLFKKIYYNIDIPYLFESKYLINRIQEKLNIIMKQQN